MCAIEIHIYKNNPRLHGVLQQYRSFSFNVGFLPTFDSQKFNYSRVPKGFHGNKLSQFCEIIKKIKNSQCYHPVCVSHTSQIKKHPALDGFNHFFYTKNILINWTTYEFRLLFFVQTEIQFAVFIFFVCLFQTNAIYGGIKPVMES